jgi:hypothetical protein
MAQTKGGDTMKSNKILPFNPDQIDSLPEYKTIDDESPTKKDLISVEKSVLNSRFLIEQELKEH